ncbi:hypothetical protein CUC44_06380 [Aeromonas lusitana]|uniref:GIY-YIG domain-containing protein n=2 Tax=Aeromonas lusitana TaxID=931529 RepID=A0A2M8HBT6_9GAMM|nr:hypothetical protein CUC44_06380 [Aeromonas lusitana]
MCCVCFLRWHGGPSVLHCSEICWQQYFIRVKMLATYIRDIYKESDKKQLADAIEEIASAVDSNGWASSGVYCFWDPQTNNILYIGLASDLYSRFREHNNLKQCPAKGCKKENIASWFHDNEYLGYSILVQSRLSQTEVARNYGKLIKSHGSDLYDPRDAIGISEGLLIEVEKLKHGQLPSWNKIGGASYGKNKATEMHIEFTELFTTKRTDLRVAQKTIREIASSAEFESFELFLHAIRQMMAITNWTFGRAWQELPDDFYAKDRIIEQHYVPNINNLIKEI